MAFATPDFPTQEPMLWLTALVVNGVLISVAQRFPVLTRAGWCHAGLLGTVLWGA